MDTGAFEADQGRTLATDKMHNVSEEKAKYEAAMRGNTVNMLPQQLLSDYTANFNRLCGNMRTLKCTDNPSKKAMARHFLMTLDRSRFKEYGACRQP
jgi:hypothetical protein